MLFYSTKIRKQNNMLAFEIMKLVVFLFALIDTLTLIIFLNSFSTPTLAVLLIVVGYIVNVFSNAALIVQFRMFPLAKIYLIGEKKPIKGNIINMSPDFVYVDVEKEQIAIKKSQIQKIVFKS